MATLPPTLEQGQTLQKSGDRPGARRCYEQVLKAEPRNGHAWFLLGTLAFAEQQFPQATTCFQRAVAVQPDFVDALFHLGVALQMQRQFAAAVEAHRRVLALKPEHIEACGNLAATLQAQGKIDEAIACYRRALGLRPDFAEVQCNLGNALQTKGDLPAAVAAYREALRLKPDFAEAHNSLGVALKAQGDLEAALAAYRAAIIAKPDYVSAHTNLGLALRAQGKWDEAIAASQQAVALDPRYVPALLTLGSSFEAQGRSDEALAVYRRILELDPKHVGAHCNIGVVLQAKGLLDDAIASYGRALALQPDHLETLTNLGTAFQAQNNLTAALARYRRATTLQPDLAQARFNEGVCQLLAGDFREGWRNYEFRWGAEQRKFKRPFTQPLWLGDAPLRGKTILVYPEQGLGDTLQFVRYVPRLAELGATVILEVQPPLQALLEKFPGAHAVIARGQPLPEFDVHCPLLSLPLAFATEAETIPASVPYLAAAAEKLTQWRARIRKGTTPKVGVVWSGGPHHKSDHLRSIPLEQFRSVLGVGSVEFLVLQKEIKPSDAAAFSAAPRLISLAAEIGDFSDTAAIIAQLDLVISVDTSVAHLAGALGKPTWILLPFAPDWRWMLGRSDSPWYPTVKLFRQTKAGDWDSVLRHVRSELEHTVGRGAESS